MEPKRESLPAEYADYGHDSHEQKGVGVMMPIEHSAKAWKDHCYDERPGAGADAGDQSGLLARIGERLRRFLDFWESWSVPVELPNGRKIIEELNKQLRLMGQLAKRQGSTVHRGLDDTHALSSQQIRASAPPTRNSGQLGRG